MAGESLRLFFALWPDQATRRALAAWSEAVHAACGGRRTPPENLHATLAFLGFTDPARLPALAEAARQVDAPAFELVIDRTGYFKQARIAWAGALTVPIALSALVENLRAQLSLLGLQFDPKPFAPHVTLARDARRPNVPAPASLRWKVSDFALVQSPGGQAPYRVLERWPLRSSGAGRT
jgi:2'-5' RNA ligase